MKELPASLAAHLAGQATTVAFCWRLTRRELSRGALYSVDRERLLAGENLAAVACANGAWELLQFEAAEETAPGRFRLQTLVRAQGGTEDAMASGAPAGAAFVRLDAATSPLGLRSGEIGRALDWRIVPAGRPTDDPAALRPTVTLGLRAVAPLSPVHLRGRFAGSGAFTLSWVRRTRVGGDPWDGLDVPLGEEIERYLAILSDGGREFRTETAAPMLALSPADQVAAFGALPARLTARVAQISLGFGPGIERGAVFDRPA